MNPPRRNRLAARLPWAVRGFAHNVKRSI
jgi:hypothetical protein